MADELVSVFLKVLVFENEVKGEKMSKKIEFRPSLACDAEDEKIKFPVVCQIKADGTRLINVDGNAVGRSLKAVKNKFTTARYSVPEVAWFDGELCYGNLTDQDLCRKTTSAINTIQGEPDTVWYVFDYLHPDVRNLPYVERYRILQDKVSECGLPFVKMMPSRVVHSLDEMKEFEAEVLSQGGEGLILRDPQGAHKDGRCTVKGAQYMRVKRFADAEGICIRLDEAEANGNEAKVNELGLTERSTHKANMTPKGMVGTFVLSLCEDVHADGKVFKKGTIVNVGPGEADHGMRKYYFENPDKILGKPVTFSFFPKGLKDCLRFCVFKNVRAEEDM
jgi:DNA ligase-1